MKNIANVKIKTFLIIFLLINLILQPICFYFYITNKTDMLNIIQHILAGLYLSLSFSTIINEYIFKLIFYKMLKGKIITNLTNKVFFITYYLMLAVLFTYWLLFFVLEYHYYSYPMSTILLVSIIELRNTYMISNGYFFCGFRVIPLDEIQWFKITKSKNTLVLRIKYQGKRSFTTTNSSSCIKELSAYFETHQITRKYNEKVS